MTWTQVMQAAVMWGPGILILAGVYGLLRRPPEFIVSFVAAQQRQASAMEQVAGRTTKLDELLVGQQLIINQQEMADRRLDAIERRLDDGFYRAGTGQG